MIKNLIVVILWMCMSWLIFRHTALWLAICAALMCAAPLARYITFRVDARNIPAFVGTSRFTTLQALTAMTIGKAAAYSGKGAVMDSKKMMRLDP